MSNTSYIILVNWNGWKDTLECLESIFHLATDDFCVIVCDNGSTDNSLEKIKEWAAGTREASVSLKSMEQYSMPKKEKPIPYQLLTKHHAEQGGARRKTQLVLIDCEKNLGFAGGNNVGIRFSLSQEDMAWCWLLNNDTVIERNALTELIKKMTIRSNAGIAGSTVVYYHQPDKVQAFGGARYFPCLGVAMHIGRFRNHRHIVNELQIEKRMAYVMGASMFISRSFIKKIGLMSEDYFLYYEELDWALRAKKDFEHVYAQDSIVFHKAGSSIGSSNSSSQRSLLADYYLMSNRLKITENFFPHCLISVRMFLFFELCIRLLQGRFKKANMIWLLITGQRDNIKFPGHG